MSKLIIMLFFIFTWLQYSLWIERNGMFDLYKIKHDILRIKLKNKKHKDRNLRLFEEIQDLNNNQEAIEERSRSELNMIKLDETYYRFIYR